jgi:hypothetical protein
LFSTKRYNIFNRKEESLVSKKTLIAIAAVVVLALIGGGLYLAHVKRQEAIAAEKARKAAEEAAKKEAEETKEVAEAPAQEEKKSLSEQIDEEIKAAGGAEEVSPEELQELTGQDVEKMMQAYEREYKEIERVLTEFNRLDNTYDYRTVTLEYLLDRAKYLGGEYKQKYEAYMPSFLEKIKNEKIVKEFDSIKIRLLRFTEEDFETPVKDYDNLTYAYVELEVRSRHISSKEEFSNILAATWVQKIDGNWKIVGESIIKELE